jgi:hypothetical protein
MKWLSFKKIYTPTIIILSHANQINQKSQPIRNVKAGGTVDVPVYANPWTCIGSEKYRHSHNLQV